MLQDKVLPLLENISGDELRYGKLSNVTKPTNLTIISIIISAIEQVVQVHTFHYLHLIFRSLVHVNSSYDKDTK